MSLCCLKSQKRDNILVLESGIDVQPQHNQVFAVDDDDEVEATAFQTDGSERIVLNSLSYLHNNDEVTNDLIGELRESIDVLKNAINPQDIHGNLATATKNIERTLIQIEQKLK